MGRAPREKKAFERLPQCSGAKHREMVWPYHAIFRCAHGIRELPPSSADLFGFLPLTQISLLVPRSCIRTRSGSDLVGPCVCESLRNSGSELRFNNPSCLASDSGMWQPHTSRGEMCCRGLARLTLDCSVIGSAPRATRCYREPFSAYLASTQQRSESRLR